MSKFNVGGEVSYTFQFVVEAENKDEAEQLAKDRVRDGNAIGSYDSPSVSIFSVDAEEE